MRNAHWFFIALTAAAAVVAVVLALQNRANSEGKPVGPSLPTAATWFSATTKNQTDSPAGSPVTETPLAEQVAQLMATHDPAQAYRAYRLISDCSDFNINHDRLAFDAAEIKNWRPGYLPGYRGMTESEKQHDTQFCGRMTERERQARLDYLAIAVRAGVQGAAVAFAVEGPFGDPSALKTRPGDLLVQEWKTSAMAQLIRAAETGTDKGALVYLSAEYYNGARLTEQNRLLAYRYLMADGMIDVDRFGSNHPLAQIFERRREIYDETVKEFGPDQRAAELAAAQRIVDNARELRKRGGGRH